MRASRLNPACRGSLQERVESVVPESCVLCDEEDKRREANKDSSLESVVRGVLSSEVLEDDDIS